MAGLGLTSSVEIGGLSSPLAIQYAPDVLDITDFGARGDGSDTADAIDYAVSRFGVYGGVLYFPPGVYGIGRPLANTVKPITFLGLGRFSSIFRILFANGNVFTPNYSGISFRNLGWEAGVVRTGGDYVYWHPDSVEGLMDNFRMTGAWGGVNVDSGSTVILNNGMLRDGVPGQGYSIRVGAGNDHKIMQVTTDNPNGQTAAGLLVEGAQSLQVTDSDFIRGGKALHLKGGYSCKFDSTYFDTSDNGVYVEAISPVVRCDWDKCGISTHNARGVTLVGASQISSLSFTGCEINDNGKTHPTERDGMLLNGKNISVSDCSIGGNQNNPGSGIVIGAGLTDSFIEGHNRIGEITGETYKNFVAIYNVGGAGNIVANNNLKSNLWGAFGGAPITNPAPYDNLT